MVHTVEAEKDRSATNYALAVVPQSGFFHAEAIKLFKQCKLCGTWKQESKEYFNHSGRGGDPDKEWDPHGYCSHCQKTKGACEREAKWVGQDNHGVAAERRARLKTEEEKVAQNARLIIIWKDGVFNEFFSNKPHERDFRRYTNFKDDWLARREEALDGNSEAAKAFEESQAEFRV